MPTLTQGRLWVLCMFSPSVLFPDCSEPIFFIAFSLILSCVAFGISISLLHAPIKSPNDAYSNTSAAPTSDWMKQPNQHWRRDHGPEPPPFDSAGFRNVMILGTLSSSLNMLLSSTLWVLDLVSSVPFPQRDWAIVS